MNDELIMWFARHMGEMGYAPTDPIERRKFINAAEKLFKVIIKDHHTEATKKYIDVVDQLREANLKLGASEWDCQRQKKNVSKLTATLKADRGFLYDAMEILAEVTQSEPPKRNYSKSLKVLREIKKKRFIT